MRRDRRSRCNSPWARCTTICHSILVHDMLLILACTCTTDQGLVCFLRANSANQAAWIFGRRNHSLIPILPTQGFHKWKQNVWATFECDPPKRKELAWPYAHSGQHEVCLHKVDSFIIHGSGFCFRPEATPALSISKCDSLQLSTLMD